MKQGLSRIAGTLLLLLLCTVAHAGTVTYIYSDPQGTPLAEADAQGNITATFDYRPYGTQALGQPPSGPGYTGHVNDPDTGFVYMQARYYDPEVGRFLSVDPAGVGVGNASKFNRYAYASNDPENFTDPDGKDSLWVQRGAHTNITIPVHFTGQQATNENVRKILLMARQLEVIDRRYSFTIISTDKPMNGILNSLDLSPGADSEKYPEAGEGINRLGGNDGHINSSNRLWLRAALHDILHFAALKDGYVTSGKGASRVIVGYLAGYSVDNIMADRSGNEVDPKEIQDAEDYGNRQRSNRYCHENGGPDHIMVCD